MVGLAPRGSAEREGQTRVGDSVLAIGDKVVEGMTTEGLVKLLVGPQALATQHPGPQLEL